jgi:hypothetical protein
MGTLDARHLRCGQSALARAVHIGSSHPASAAESPSIAPPAADAVITRSKESFGNGGKTIVRGAPVVQAEAMSNLAAESVSQSVWLETASSNYVSSPSLNEVFLSFDKHYYVGFTSIDLATPAEQERALRVKEMHDLIDKLKGTPQTFTVELKSDNSLIVHCEGRSQASILLDKYEVDFEELENLETASAEAMDISKWVEERAARRIRDT